MRDVEMDPRFLKGILSATNLKTLALNFSIQLDSFVHLDSLEIRLWHSDDVNYLLNYHHGNENLKSLRIDCGAIPVSLAQFTSLTSLDLGVDVMLDEFELFRLTNLKRLEFSHILHSNFVSMGPLSRLRDVEELTFHSFLPEELDELIALFSLSNFKKVSLNSVMDNFPPLDESAFEGLSVSCYWIDDDADRAADFNRLLSALSRKKLRNLRVEVPTMNFASMARISLFPNLESLELIDFQFTGPINDDFLLPLFHLKKLRYLKLSKGESEGDDNSLAQHEGLTEVSIFGLIGELQATLVYLHLSNLFYYSQKSLDSIEIQIVKKYPMIEAHLRKD